MDANGRAGDALARKGYDTLAKRTRSHSAMYGALGGAIAPIEYMPGRICELDIFGRRQRIFVDGVGGSDGARTVSCLELIHALALPVSIAA